MQVVIDIETNSLVKPTKLWVIVCKDIATNEYHIFRNLTDNAEETQRFLRFTREVDTYIGHNILGYDYPVLVSLIPGFNVPDISVSSYDTLVLSKLIDYPRTGHSIEHYGEEFGIEKIKFNNFKEYSQEMEDYCVRDVDICHRVYSKYLAVVNDPLWDSSIRTEQRFQLVVNRLHSNGFSFNVLRANDLLSQVTTELAELDQEILKEFPPKLKLIRVIEPKVTKHGTLSKVGFKFVEDGDLSEYNGGPFCRCSWVPFNPGSHKQITAVLNQAGWSPIEKTQTHIDIEREINRLKYLKNKDERVDIRLTECYNKIIELQQFGYKISETNLGTLPDTAPSPARTLARRILVESRRRTLTEWLSLVTEDGRVHGKFFGIGAWTGRMAHQQPNTANIPNEYEQDGTKKYLGKELRSLWQAPKGRLLVGVDAESIQLRVFAHYVNDPVLINAIVNGKKSDKTDPHSFNKTVLGDVCKTRQAAKRFLYALFLGGGLGRLASILGCSTEDTKDSLDRLVRQYPGFEYLKQEVIPADARRGYFIGLDGRKVRIPGLTVSERKHLCMSGYLQNGEKVIMELATLKWEHKLADYDAMLVNLVHDEWQVECPNNFTIARKIAKMMADSLKDVGEELKLHCPMAGSFFNDDIKDYTIGLNWSVTH